MVSNDASQTQADFPHLLILADQGQGLSATIQIIHPHAGRSANDDDAAYPTTILVDRTGTVRWLHRSSVIARPASDEVLAVIDQHNREGSY